MFTVEEDGTIGDLKVAKGLGGPYDKAALEIFKKMPNWKPRALNGRPIRMKMMMPFTFH